MEKSKALGAWVKTFFRVFLETLPLFGLIFIINPILIVFSTSEPASEYQTSFAILSLACVCACVLTALPISFFSNKYRRIAIAFLRSLFLISFIVTIFYPEGGRQLDGVAAANHSFFYYCVLYFFYIISVSFFTILFFRGNVVLRNIYVTFAILGFVSISYYYYTFQNTINSENQTYYFDKFNLSFASDRNIVVILADMLQGSTLEQYFMMNPKEQNNFQGFTLFSRATSPFPYTNYGAPALFSGNMYSSSSNKSSVQARKDAETSSFLTDAISSGFDNTVIGLSCIKAHENQISYVPATPEEKALTLFSLSIQRMIKKSVHILGFDPQMMLLVGYKKTSKDIMERLAVAPIGKSKNKILFFHSMVPHAPLVFRRKYLKSMPLFLKPLEWNVENYWDEMGFFVGQVTRLLDHMKRIGIYDNALIIVTGDHGHFIGEQDDLYKYPGTEDFDGIQKGPWARTAAMYNAAILIKPPLMRDSLQISRVASSTLGLRPLIKRYLTDKTSDLLKDFEILGKNKVVVFKDKIKSNPYEVVDDHVVLEFTGNVSSLPEEFVKNISKYNDISYKIGMKITDIGEYLVGPWIRDNDHAWLKGRPAKLVIRPSGVEKKIYKLQMVLKGLLNNKHRVQRVRLWLNDKELGMLSIKKRKKNMVELEIPMDLLVNDSINEFKFEPLDAISPKEINAWTTTVPLSIFLYSFQILEARKQ
ncbi:MAG: hypothetical protein BGO67_01915 [Alphaproteobacteria bacterium 41-28]|nr:MAG: hypothetical protein BGO67_01915 [Alphaproteobacteria bacterium 41-28]